MLPATWVRLSDADPTDMLCMKRMQSLHLSKINDVQNKISSAPVWETLTDDCSMFHVIPTYMWTL